MGLLMPRLESQMGLTDIAKNFEVFTILLEKAAAFLKEEMSAGF